VSISDDDWMLWNFYHKQQDITEISNQVPIFHDVHHVRVKMLAEQVACFAFLVLQRWGGVAADFMVWTNSLK